jgi:hypothetical protein
LIRSLFVPLLIVGLLLGGASLVAAPLFANTDPIALSCPNNIATTLRGSGAPPFEPLVVFLNNRSVGGGASDGSGAYAIAITPRESPGEYPVEVRSRENQRAVYGRFICFVDVPLGATATSPDSPPAGSPAPTVGAPTANVPTVTTASATAAIGTQTPATATSAASASPTGTATTTASPTTSPTTIPTAAATAEAFIFITLEPGDPSNSDDLGSIDIELVVDDVRYDMSGWKLVNVTQNKTYIFPSGFIIGLDEDGNGTLVATVEAGAGENDFESGLLYWGQTVHPWASGDEVELRDGADRVIIDGETMP